MTPKSLLRHPQAQSSFDEIGPGTHFRALLPDEQANPEKVRKLLLCSGKVYFDLLEERKKKGLDDKIAIIRVEQLCPFPYKQLADHAAKFSDYKVRCS